MMKFHSNGHFSKVINILFSSSFIIIMLLTSLVSCNRFDIEKRYSEMDSFAQAHGFTKSYVAADDFHLTVYAKITDRREDYNIYIEGDGFAYFNGLPTDNPTPTTIMLPELASLDKHSNVIYIARPCQYTTLTRSPKCNQIRYWTSERYTNEVVTVVNQVISKVTDDKPVKLIGYSGGGTIAMLVAARNKHVKSIITVAGNVDVVAFNNYRHFSTMIHALNPVDYIANTKHIPQLHLSGENDKVVLPSFAQNFIKQNNSPCVKGQIIKNASHSDGWRKIWPEIIAQPLTCNH